MANYEYLIVGGGMTADAALRGIRELDRDGRVAIIGSDENPPYNRPPLTKGLWKGKTMDKVWRRTQELPVDLILGCTIRSIDPHQKVARDDQGGEYHYEKLLLATGGTPRKLPFGPGGIIYYRTLDDYHHLRQMTEQKDHFAVIGGNFIGSEIAAALSMNGKQVTMFFPEDGIAGRIYPRDLSDYVTDYFRQKGVQVLAGVSVQDIQSAGEKYRLVTNKSGEIEADGVVAGIGIQPNVDLAKQMGLEIGNGIVVDELLRTSQADIFAAGDVAEFMSPTLGKRMRFEHEDNANSMGKQAGRNMAGASEPYTHLPYFYSDLFELGYEAVGELEARLETFADWKEPYKKGVVYYLKDGRVRGVLLWNVWDSVPKARELIAQPGPFNAGNLKDRI
jgi:NADPH-dependent 2,4-dienoyl-CoA reductase/sulfur reductase-like enzyme